MNMQKCITLINIVNLLICGCSFFTAPKEKPVVQSLVDAPIWGKDTTSVFSLTPERRMIIVMPREEMADVNKNKNLSKTENTVAEEKAENKKNKEAMEKEEEKSSETKTKDKKSRKVRLVKFCAEPPPDVAENLLNSFRIIAEAQIKKSTGTSINAELAKTFSSTATSLFYRSQGVQLFRDGMYNLCQAYLNGIVKNEDDYIDWYDKLRTDATDLIKKEIDKMIEIRVYESNAQSIKILNEAIKSLIDIKMQAEDIKKIKKELEERQKGILEKLKKLEKNSGNGQ